MKYLISGGGTGGHIFPAVSIANALKAADQEADILFVGALGRMEMERVPQAGYKIVGLPVRGFNRAQLWKNISVLFDLWRSMRMAKRIVREFKPDAAVGVGGYASGAAMKVAARMGIPVILQEQNGFAGVTNKLLKDDAQLICVAYEGMERFFPKEKIMLTGNPVRQNLTTGDKTHALQWLNEEYGAHFVTDKPTILIIGGSLGARTINEAMISALPTLAEKGIQLIWQTGKAYFDKIIESQKAKVDNYKQQGIVITPFLSNMPDAYALADIVVSRAGASSISELCLLGKACILIPSPNVAEDHQTHNAMALVRKDAAVLVKDVECNDKLLPAMLDLLADNTRQATMRKNILGLAQTNSAARIAEEVIRIAKSRKNGHTSDER